jgi:hypothetical protein
MVRYLINALNPRGAYVRSFACLICCFEFQLKQIARIIAKNFGFLYDAKSRAIFLIL